MFRRGANGLIVASVVVLASMRALAAEEPAVALPPFLVEELAKGPPWRYAESEGYEVLSRCNDTTTRRVLETHQRLHVLLGELLPPALQYTVSMPRALILYDEELQPAASREVIARMLRPTSPLPENNYEPIGGARGFRGVAIAPPRVSFLPNLRLWDRDAFALFMIIRRDDFDSERLSLTPDYVTFLVANRLPALPTWFSSGLLTLYGQTTFTRAELTVAPLEWRGPSLVPPKQEPPSTEPPPPAVVLKDLLAGRTEAPVGDLSPSDQRARWQSQAALFVRWGIDPVDRARRAAFWKFTERVAAEGGSEKLFLECFGFDYAAAQPQLTAYLATAMSRSLRLRPARSVKFPRLVLQNATDAQIGRIKGDWERLEVPFVKAISAELAPKYLEQARRTLKRAYDRNSGDPQLLAVMGLCESDAGNNAAAREYLEMAVRIGPIRPRANYELARLRFLEAKETPAAPNGRLDVTQMAEVLKPLFAAREAKPPLPEVYELIAEVWASGVSTPTRRHLAVLDEGVRFFPRRVPLVLSTAELNLRHGYRAEAATLAGIGLQVATDPVLRERAAALQKQAEAP